MIASLCAQQGVQWDDKQMQMPSQDITHATITKFEDWAEGEPNPRGKSVIIQPASSVPPPQPTHETEVRMSTQATQATAVHDDSQLRRLEWKVDAMYENFAVFATGLTRSLAEAFIQ